MHHSSSNRGTPVSGDNITKIVRQHFKPASSLPYKPEEIQCRTGTHCKANKPEDYWVVNYRRRRGNLDRGYNTAITNVYKPIGGEIILDPYELVMSSLSGHVDKKPRVTRRGTVYESNSPTKSLQDDLQSKKDSSLSRDDLMDNYSSAGFDSIKKLLWESRQRIICVRGGLPYEEHIRQVEEAERATLETSKPVDTGMNLHSLSSLCLPKHGRPNSHHSSTPTGSPRTRSPSVSLSSRSPSPRVTTLKSMFSGSRKQKEERMAQYTGFGPMLSTAESLKTGTCSYIEKSRRKSMAVKSGRGSSILKSPLPEEQDTKLSLIKCSSGITTTLLRKERRFRDHYLYLKMIYNILNALHNMKTKDIRSKVPLSKDLVEKLQKESQFQREEERAGSRGGSKFERNTRASTLEMDNHEHRMSMFGTVKRATAADAVGKGFFARRRSRNTTSLSMDRPAVETWEDLLNVQPQEYKEEAPSIGLQFGIVFKFMRWFRQANVVPQHAGPTPTIDQNAPAHKSQMHEGRAQEGRAHEGRTQDQRKESNIGFTHPSTGGSPQGHTEKAKKLPIWQQVAQEKSTIFHNKKQKAPNPDTTILRCKRDLNKLKKSLQKENTAELEKLVRERAASFRLKFGMLNVEEASPLVEEQLYRIQEVCDKVNKSRLENFEVQPSKWYEELRDQTQALIASYNQPDIEDMISKLQTFSHMDNKTLPFAKAKLCLLMMSLPAYDICHIYTQRALKFILENILLGADAQFQEWLNHRKIPFMILNGNQDTDKSESNKEDQLENTGDEPFKK